MKEIKLTQRNFSIKRDSQRKSCLIDDEDYDLISSNHWCLGTKGHVIRTCYENNKHHTQMMHRVILERKLGRLIKEGFDCHHIDGNKLNNCRINLAEISHRDHIRIEKYIKATGYAGIYKDKRTGHYHAIANDKFGNRKLYEVYNSEIDAAVRYYQFIKSEFGGEIALLIPKADYLEKLKLLNNPIERSKYDS